MSEKNNDFDIVVLNFADSKLPEFKEVRNRDYILCGEKNDYPEYLVYQYNKCGKHRAIINGKTRYILGSGLEKKAPIANSFAPYTNEQGITNPGASINKAGETMFDVLQKSIKDIEIHGGFRWFITWNALGKIAEIYHEDFYKFRTGKDGGYYWKNKWKTDKGYDTQETPKYYTEFNGKPPVAPQGTVNNDWATQVFAYNEYGPGSDYYPLPEYVGCSNYIDIDIEISKFHLSSIRNGMMPSKMVQFFTGEPTDEKKKDIEKRFEKKFAGSENAGRFILVFNTSKEKSVEINDLSASELDKQFEILNKTAQQEIFTGHQVTSPMLFGIKTEGQLGGNTELKTAYEIFINTYAKPKQANIEKIVNYFGNLLEKGNDYTISQLDPIGVTIDIKDVLSQLPKEYIYDKLNIPKEYRGLPSVNPGITGANPVVQQESVNDNLKNLTAKQHQQLLRIIREYSKGKLSKEAAIVLLKSGLALSDDEIKSMLGIEEEQQFSESEDSVIQMFNSCGDLKDDFFIVQSKKVKFSSDDEAADDELNFYALAFAKELTNSEASIVDLIRKDKRITPEIIAETIGSTPEYVTAKIAKLVKAGIISTEVVSIGEDSQIERTITKDFEPTTEPETTEIYIKYSYEGPRDDRNRPFCRKLLDLSRLYSRAEIESISQRLGYSVFDRRGGWWTKPSGERSPSCRHSWMSHVVVRKGGKK